MRNGGRAPAPPDSGAGVEKRGQAPEPSGSRVGAGTTLEPRANGVAAGMGFRVPEPPDGGAGVGERGRAPEPSGSRVGAGTTPEPRAREVAAGMGFHAPAPSFDGWEHRRGGRELVVRVLHVAGAVCL
ncbi:hypothetical protein ACIP5Y_03035 [Nocardia sp. NPDC088792]|uniref:hypothetical protein n=1 Tax=Nocardia sp. NPDC088792 TaxID=3364332 RepID=UPI00381CF231